MGNKSMITSRRRGSRLPPGAAAYSSRSMHRRALLLFAIVLGLAALAASLSRPRTDRSGEDRLTRRRRPRRPRRSRRRSPPRAAGKAHLRRLRRRDLRAEAGRPAAVAVEVEEAGQVVIPSLGLDEPAQPLTPALFDLLLSEPGRHEIEFTPSEGDETRGAGRSWSTCSPAGAGGRGTCTARRRRLLERERAGRAAAGKDRWHQLHRRRPPGGSAGGGAPGAANAPAAPPIS